MSQKLWKLKQSDAGDTFSDSDFDGIFKTGPRSIGLAKGAIIGGAYKIIRLIGRGAMGEVYLAEHITLNKRCALKVIPPEQVTEIGWLRFQTEARSVAKLDHANLVKVSDLGIHDHCLPYYAMEYVDGRSMADLLRDQGPMPLKTALAIFDQICDGLDYAHRNSIIHRDIKPANIMLTKGTDGTITVKVLDFGLAKLTQQDRHTQSLTSVGEVMGSPFYMSPEQCEGGRIDRRSDIYSLGCTMFECLVGSPPFDDDEPAVIVNNHLSADAPTLESVVGLGVFPESMEVVEAKLLRKNPVERYQSMAELRGDLKRVANGEEVLPFYMSRSSYVGRAGNTPGNAATRQQKIARKGQSRPEAPQAIAKQILPLAAVLALILGGLCAAELFASRHQIGQFEIKPDQPQTAATYFRSSVNQSRQAHGTHSGNSGICKRNQTLLLNCPSQWRDDAPVRFSYRHRNRKN